MSEAGGLGVVGASFLSPETTAEVVRRARKLTSKPTGVNLLLHATKSAIVADAEEILRSRFS